MIDSENFLHEKMRSLGAANYKKFLCNELIQTWDKLIDADIAEKVRPVTIERDVLFVDVKNSAFKDQLKFFAEEIVDAINDAFKQEPPLVKEVKIAKGFQIAEMPPEKISESAQVEKPQVTLEQIILTDEEIQRCQARAEKFSDDSLRETVLQTLMSQVRIQKFRLANGWHKCRNCDKLCPPQEIFCEVCRIKERNLMIEELFRIFYDEPWLKALDAQKILLDRMPHMRDECQPDVIESARTSLIQKIAGGIRFGDEESPDVLKLVMLEKRLPPDKITPAIIRRTLMDLQFNLAEQPKVQRYLLKILRK